MELNEKYLTIIYLQEPVELREIYEDILSGILSFKDYISFFDKLFELTDKNILQLDNFQRRNTYKCYQENLIELINDDRFDLNWLFLPEGTELKGNHLSKVMTRYTSKGISSDKVNKNYSTFIHLAKSESFILFSSLFMIDTYIKDSILSPNDILKVDNLINSEGCQEVYNLIFISDTLNYCSMTEFKQWIKVLNHVEMDRVLEGYGNFYHDLDIITVINEDSFSIGNALFSAERLKLLEKYFNLPPYIFLTGDNLEKFPELFKSLPDYSKYKDILRVFNIPSYNLGTISKITIDKESF